ncbi:DUF2076 domain-containing protein [Xanthobacter sp. V3C-3]|uniref:DUF2076 domain-containing protein n=1 Tax=Xanthobacter lutulentifluminis TaxID=3119935 RepID=UPI00372C5C6C
MTPEERALIDGLFDRMRGVANQPRDAEAEALIARRVTEAPHATYALAQSVIVQEHALQQAYGRIQELEAQARPASGGGFLGGLFGGGRSSVPSAGSRGAGEPMGLPPGYGQQGGGYASQGYPQGGYPQGGPQQGYGQQGGYPPPPPQGGPWGQQAQPRGGFGGGGFLQGALATAAGVAGGALLFDGIKSMMAGGGGAVGQQAAAELGHTPASTGDLGRDAQSALGGDASQQAAADAGQGAGQDNFWNSDPGAEHQEASFDDGGDWGSDDDGSWA